MRAVRVSNGVPDITRRCCRSSNLQHAKAQSIEAPADTLEKKLHAQDTHPFLCMHVPVLCLCCESPAEESKGMVAVKACLELLLLCPNWANCLRSSCIAKASSWWCTESVVPPTALSAKLQGCLHS